MEDIQRLRDEIARREQELKDLKSQLAAAEVNHNDSSPVWKWPLQPEDYERYSRQMIIPNFGLQGQLRIKNAKVLIVGAGGLGCPAAAYLAGAGVQTLGLVDGDTVETSNLHRQIAHSSARVSMPKVHSAVAYLRDLNPCVSYNAYETHLTTDNARSIVSEYDLVLDCTDHPTSRYLISDICVLLGKPLVSASAFQTSGQLIILNSPPGKGPCYRCVFPKPPPPDTVVSCGQGGILGPIVGTMGVLQALEAIKLIARGGLEEKEDAVAQTPMLLLFSGMADTPFRSVRMRGKRKDCFACAETGGLTLVQLESSMDYVQFCGISEDVAVLQPEERITAEEYNKLTKDGSKHTLLDVREKEHFSLCNLEGSLNIPFSRIIGHREGEPDWVPADIHPDTPIYLICARGNDSQIAAKKLKDRGLDRSGQRFIGDVKGGLQAYKTSVDPSMPFL
ncbi:hypothetical protein B0I35DRAFT_452387 [Stachybotrys elegans]|uniref:Adenylyltransferase and sulfurtransferase uba4 n=1 Tax=Stachybotrys elegans TaxID=80388 RepID=A0A8K0SMK7_9HYPO|nr:hypothetical protein B0I35DRAFT_452387 [Stachybotrys elegans]